MKNIVQTSNAPKPIGPYSQAINVGNFIFVSGQLPINPKVGKLVNGSIEEQTRQVMDNVKAILEAAGFNFKDVVQTTVYLSSLTMFDEFNREYAKYFTEAFPARSTIGCELKTGALIEISIVAYKE